jgi:predicted Fe-Mo cluster-binding NifX family protein
MRLAVPVWGNRISPVLDSATRLLILEVKEGGELSRSEIDLDEKAPSRRCQRMLSLGVDALICGAVTRSLSDMIRASGIFLIPGVSGPPDEVLHACMEGKLNRSEFLMPGWSLDGLTEQMRDLDMSRFGKNKPQRLR